MWRIKLSRITEEHEIMCLIPCVFCEVVSSEKISLCLLQWCLHNQAEKHTTHTQNTWWVRTLWGALRSSWAGRNFTCHVTHHRSVNIPERLLLTVQNLPLDFVSFLVHSDRREMCVSTDVNHMWCVRFYCGHKWLTDGLRVGWLTLLVLLLA